MLTWTAILFCETRLLLVPQDIPKDMALPLPDNTDYFDMFEWYFAPVCPTRKDDKAKKKSSRRKGPKQLPGLKLSPEQHQYAVEELEEVLGARKDLGVRFAKKSKKQKEDKKAKEKETDEEEEEEDSSEDESLTSESMQEIESDRESDLGNLEEEIEELQKQEHVDSSKLKYRVWQTLIIRFARIRSQKVQNCLTI
eukprot:gb/GECG01001760.1/.p1 GENE.gb/GECG01001760.1/~~gb/GECG01001760.1/.p1  ORF type:complete len:196 (+),score=49.56 gb/GECG01001760.1/:1-588(+)